MDLRRRAGVAAADGAELVGLRSAVPRGGRAFPEAARIEALGAICRLCQVPRWNACGDMLARRRLTEHLPVSAFSRQPVAVQ